METFPYNCHEDMAKEKKTVRKELRLSPKAWDCAEEQAARVSRSFNNYIEFLILENCKKK